MDWLPTLLAMAGEPDIKEKLRKGISARHKLSRFIWTATTCCLILTAREKKSPRLSTSISLTTAISPACVIDNWKLVFMEQRATAPLRIWASRLSLSRAEDLQPANRSLRNAPTSHRIRIMTGLIDHVYLQCPQQIVGQFLSTFKEFPPAEAASFSIDQVMEKLTRAGDGVG